MPELAETLIAAIGFAVVFLYGDRLVPRHARYRRAGISVAAGASLAYVFVHLLPELGSAASELVEAAEEASLPFVEMRIYLAALAGFIFFLGLESMVARSRRRAEVDDEGQSHSLALFRVHTLSFAPYVWLVTYMMVRGVRESTIPVALYALAMGLHFLSVDHALSREHPRRYRRPGRQILAASALAGWLCGLLAQFPQQIILVLLGIVSGGVIMNTMIEELPSDKEGRFWPLASGAAAYACLLLLLGRA